MKNSVVLDYQLIKYCLAQNVNLDAVRSEFMPRGGKGSLAENYRQPKKEDAVRESAVALILVPSESDAVPELLLTQRAMHLKHHKGQLSFPGGRIEQHENALEAAIRETREEVGLQLDSSNLVGELSPLYVFGSRNWVKTFVFYHELSITEKDLNIDPSEVAQAMLIPLNHFMEKDHRSEVLMHFAGYERVVPHWKIPQTEVPLWGATALILNELIAKINMMK